LTPVQTVDFSNNRGFGYNFVEDSTILTGSIRNGNFENCNIGTGNTYSALDIYFGLTYSFPLKLTGSFNRCDILNITAESSKFNNSNVYNSNMTSTEIVNSQIYKSTAVRSKFTDEEGIKVISADIWSYITNQSNPSTIRGVLKLYISDSDARKINVGDAFYLTKLNKNLFLSSLTNDQKVKIPIETKYLLDIYSDFELSNDKIVVSVKNKNDNKIKSFVSKNGSTYDNIFVDNKINKK
jgi:hypothetical protein